jgi:hypothetical protein
VPPREAPAKPSTFVCNIGHILRGQGGDDFEKVAS